MKMMLAPVLVIGLATFGTGCGGNKPAPTLERRNVSAESPAHVQAHAAVSAPAEGQAAQYTCSMHPEIISDKPGKCPKCGMALIPIADGGAAATDSENEAMTEENDEPASAPTRRAGSDLVNVNTATLAELDAVNGIGKATAKKIIAYREEHGPLRSIDDLKAAGVTHCVLGNIKNKISFTGDGVAAAASTTSSSPTHGSHTTSSPATSASTTSSPAERSGPRTNVNTATAAQIKAAVPRMSLTTAEAIVATRKSAGGKFTNWSDIDAIPGIGEVTIAKLKIAFELK
jgi:competence ComEA-like helix-hairpin-helix protein